MAGEAASTRDETESERITVAALLAPGILTEASQLHGRGKWAEETTLVPVLIRKRTGVKNRWVAG